MGRNRMPPVPGGVVWWDLKGKRHHTEHPPPAPTAVATQMLIIGVGLVLSAVFGVFVISSFISGSSAMIILGIVLCVVGVFVLIIGCNCYYTRKDETITLVFPLSGAVQYITGGKTTYEPPDNYTPPAGFEPPQPGMVYQTIGGVPVPLPSNAQVYVPMQQIEGQEYYPNAAAPPPGQHPYYSSTAAPPPGQHPYYSSTAAPPPGQQPNYISTATPPTGQRPYYNCTGYACPDPSRPSAPPPVSAETTDKAGGLPPSYDQVMNKH